MNYSKGEFRALLAKADHLTQEEKDELLGKVGEQGEVFIVNQLAAQDQVLPVELEAKVDVSWLLNYTPEFRTQLERDAWNEWIPTVDGCVAHFYEAITFRMDPKNKYTPDFMLVMADGTLQFVEAKGSWKSKNARESRAKLRTTAKVYGFMGTFIGLTRVKGEWEVERF